MYLSVICYRIIGVEKVLETVIDTELIKAPQVPEVVHVNPPGPPDAGNGPDGDAADEHEL